MSTVAAKLSASSLRLLPISALEKGGSSADGVT